MVKKLGSLLMAMTMMTSVMTLVGANREGASDSAAPFGDTVHSVGRGTPDRLTLSTTLEGGGTVNRVTPDRLLQEDYIADNFLFSIEREEALVIAEKIIDDLDLCTFETAQEAINYIADNYLSDIDPILAQDLAYNIIVALLGEITDGNEE